MKKRHYGLASLAVIGMFAMMPMCASAEGAVSIDEKNFPDANFRSYVAEKLDSNGDGSLSDEEIENVTTMSVSDRSIRDLTGIKYFTQLEYLYCSENSLSTLDLSGLESLNEVDCENNMLTELNVNGCICLNELHCHNNRLSSLDLSTNEYLSVLRCEGNNITCIDTRASYLLKRVANESCNTFYLGTLDIYGSSRSYAFPDDYLILYGSAIAVDSPSSSKNGVILIGDGMATDKKSIVTTIDEASFPDSRFREFVKENCDYNSDGYLDKRDIDLTYRLDIDGDYSSEDGNITNLKGIEYFTGLTELSCCYNSLRKLDFKSNPELTSLSCVHCDLSELDVSNNSKLRYIQCSWNDLTTLNLDNNPELEELFCDDNKLDSLEVDNNPKLKYLCCGNNQIKELNLNNNPELVILDCGDNEIALLDISNNKKLLHNSEALIREKPVPMFYASQYEDENAMRYEMPGGGCDGGYLPEYILRVDKKTRLKTGYDYMFSLDCYPEYEYIIGYVDKDGVKQTGFVKIKKKYYYFDPQTYGMKKGVLKLDGSVYYMDPETGAMHTGWLDYKGSRYYFNSKGVMQTGAKKIDGSTYYFDKKSGKQVTGVLKTSEGVFYLDPDNNGAMHTGWLVYNNAKYYFGDNGKMVTGPKVIDGKTYYFDKKSGKMKTGVLKAGGKIFYLNKDGSMHIGWLTLKGNLYYLQEDGSLAVDCTLTIDGEQYSFGPDGIAIAVN